jgi:hypothetical protein
MSKCSVSGQGRGDGSQENLRPETNERDAAASSHMSVDKKTSRTPTGDDKLSGKTAGGYTSLRHSTGQNPIREAESSGITPRIHRLLLNPTVHSCVQNAAITPELDWCFSPASTHSLYDPF